MKESQKRGLCSRHQSMQSRTVPSTPTGSHEIMTPERNIRAASATLPSEFDSPRHLHHSRIQSTPQPLMSTPKKVQWKLVRLYPTQHLWLIPYSPIVKRVLDLRCSVGTRVRQKFLLKITKTRLKLTGKNFWVQYKQISAVKFS